MLRVYVLYDECPSEFGDAGIVEIFMTPKGAKDEEVKRKKADPYQNQYLVVKPFKVTER